MKSKHFYGIAALVAAGVALWYLTRAAKSSTPPAVPGTVTSGGQSITIDSNVLSPNFGLPINNA